MCHRNKCMTQNLVFLIGITTLGGFKNKLEPPNRSYLSVRNRLYNEGIIDINDVRDIMDINNIKDNKHYR